MAGRGVVHHHEQQANGSRFEENHDSKIINVVTEPARESSSVDCDKLYVRRVQAIKVKMEQGKERLKGYERSSYKPIESLDNERNEEVSIYKQVKGNKGK